MGIQYNQESLYKDIEQLNEVTHPFSIVVIKDTFNKYPNRFLLYYDERWNCKLFFNYRTVEDNEKNIISRLSNELKVKKEDIAVDFVTEQIYRKYSVSDKKDKVYDHRIYHVDIAEFSKNSMENEFEIDGKKFYWMTLNDMEKDADIREKNIELVDIVKTSIG